jgi:TPP-dependent pyruvate/acetoin dehydrogenase alpha subunit
LAITSATVHSLPRPKLAEHSFQKPLLNSPSTAEQEFLEISQKSPIERLRDKILEDMKTSEEAIAQMEPEERQAVEDEIKRRMMEALQGSSEAGAVVDKTA